MFFVFFYCQPGLNRAFPELLHKSSITLTALWFRATTYDRIAPVMFGITAFAPVWCCLTVVLFPYYYRQYRVRCEASSLSHLVAWGCLTLKSSYSVCVWCRPDKILNCQDFKIPGFLCLFSEKSLITIKCLRHEGKIAERRTALTIPDMLKAVLNIFVSTLSIAHVAEHVHVTQKSVFCGRARVTSSAPRWCSFKRIFFSSKWVKNRGRPSKTRASLSLSLSLPVRWSAAGEPRSTCT